ncbi:protease pro-enzyme activation domain-containing protein [Granulicella rosea]|nr:protease pro-enzyme activation domain-containing protein [Granulicella rosea]
MQPSAVAQGATASATASPRGGVAARITDKIDGNKRSALTGHVRPFLRYAEDHGSVADDQKTAPIMLMFSRTKEQQAELDSLVDELHNKNSPSFHKWLTPEQFGAKFGPADSDVAAVKAWLESQGFTVLDVVPSKTYISFQGTTGQLRAAFKTEIHHVSLNGEAHMATINEPQIPTALLPVIGGMNKLDDFGGKPLMRKAGLFKRDLKTGKTTLVSGTSAAPRATDPAFTFNYSSDNFYNVGPQDFYTIYNENPLLKAGINGAGQTIAVIEEVQVAAADVTSFRSQFGLPAYPATPNATAGGVNYLIGSSTGLNGYASCFAPVTQAKGKSSGEEGEADLDLQWSGAVAPNAIIDFVACGGTKTSGDGTTLGALGIDHSAQYVANYLSGTVVAASMSYGECEADMTSSATNGVGYYNNQWQQFAAEGITAVISSGDGGSEQCYQNDANATTLPPSVNGFGSSAYNVSAGGTDLGDDYESLNYTTTPVETWWNDTNGPGFSSATGYVPETTWTSYCANTLFGSILQAEGSTTFGTDYTPSALCSSSYSTTNGYTAVVGGAGGISTYNAIPTWQNVYGVGVNSVSSTFRNLPDVSLFAANGFWGHTLPFCESDETACSYTVGADAYNLGSGGTSFVAPQLAGFMALVAQKTGQRQGQANYTFYNLAAQQYGTPSTPSSSLASCSGSGVTPGQAPPNSCYFYDVSNDMPSLQGGTITAGNYQPCLVGDIDCFQGTGVKYGVSTVPGTVKTAGVLAYTASPGYDDATGLGSMNITGVVQGWNNVTPSFASTTVLGTSAATVTSTTSVTLTATVTATGRGGAVAPAGTVTFFVGSTSGTNLGAGTIASSCSGTGATTACKGVATLALAGSSLANGVNNIVAYFGGDGANDAPSTSAAVVVTESTVAPLLGFVTAPPSTLTAGGNAGTVQVAVETSTGAVSTSSSGVSVSLAVTGPGYSATTTALTVNGIASFPLGSTPLTAAGAYTYTATSASLTQTQVSEAVVAGPAALLTIAGVPTPASLLVVYGGTAKVTDAYGNPATSFTGTVTLASSDPSVAITPATHTFTTGEAGVTIFKAVFSNAGAFTITGTSGVLTGSESGIAVLGAVYILNADASVSRYNTNGVLSYQTAANGTATAGVVAVDGNGTAWAVTNSTLEAYTTVGDAISVNTLGSGVNAPVSVAVDGGSNVWVANGNNSVSELTSTGTAISPSTGYTGVTTATTGGATNYSAPAGIAIDLSGNVWVSNSTANTVTEILGAATPAAPLSTAVTNVTTGARP